MKILIVEDHEALSEAMVGYLTHRGHEVVGSGSIATARDALEHMLAAAQPPQAIVCDRSLPDGDGLDFYSAFASRTPGCRWLLMSGGHHFDDRLATKLGLAGETGPAPIIVEKPVRMRVLQQLVEEGSIH